MQVGDPTVIASVVIAPDIAPVRPPVRETRDGRAADRDSRDKNAESGSSFRATLNSVLPEGTASGFAPTVAPDTSVAAQTPRPEKLPPASQELDGAESAQLYTDALTAPRDESPTHDGFADTPAPVVQQYRSVTRQYAQSYFSVGGTFAARGDSLEISA